MQDFCAAHRKSLYRQLYDLVKHGGLGSYEEARRMPTEIRRFWFEQLAADRKAEEEEFERAKRARG